MAPHPPPPLAAPHTRRSRLSPPTGCGVWIDAGPSSWAVITSMADRRRKRLLSASSLQPASTGGGWGGGLTTVLDHPREDRGRSEREPRRVGGGGGGGGERERASLFNQRPRSRPRCGAHLNSVVHLLCNGNRPPPPPPLFAITKNRRAAGPL